MITCAVCGVPLERWDSRCHKCNTSKKTWVKPRNCECPRLDESEIMHHSTCTDETPYKNPYPPPSANQAEKGPYGKHRLWDNVIAGPNGDIEILQTYRDSIIDELNRAYESATLAERKACGEAMKVKSLVADLESIVELCDRMQPGNATHIRSNVRGLALWHINRLKQIESRGGV